MIKTSYAALCRGGELFGLEVHLRSSCELFGGDEGVEVLMQLQPSVMAVYAAQHSGGLGDAN